MATGLDIDSAQALDSDDELGEFRDAFEFPRRPEGEPWVYFCGHSLGLMPRAARGAVAAELDRWSELGAAGHFDAESGWYSIHERFSAPLANLLGAEPEEVVAMNSLTVNLHLMLVSFFEPDGKRCRMLIERDAFPSDRYAVQSQLRWHGLDPDRDLIEIGGGGKGLDADTLDAALREAAGTVALVLLPGLQYLSGAAVDLAACAEVARSHGCRIGFDLAHAIGNLDIDLRATDPDFAIWCSYKYLNAGPGAIGGCFVNRRWVRDPARPRLEGWWGHDKSRRFESAPQFSAIASAEAWQLSNPPVLAMAPLVPSLEIFGRAGIGRLRKKSIALTGFLEALLEQECGRSLEQLTPTDPAARGAQLSLRIGRSADACRKVVAELLQKGVCLDWRAPDIVRIAPVPLYNSFADVHAGVRLLRQALGD